MRDGLEMIVALAKVEVLSPPEHETFEGSSRALLGDVKWDSRLRRWCVCIKEGAIDRTATADGEEYFDEESRWWAIPPELLSSVAPITKKRGKR